MSCPEQLDAPASRAEPSAAFPDGVSMITGEDEFRALRPAWNRLAAKCPELSLFASHEWFDAAWQWRKESAQLRILVLSQSLGVTAILPLLVETIVRQGIKARELTFLTVPDTQACDLLAAAPDRPTAAAAFATELARRMSEWDVLRLSQLPASSTAIKAMAEALQARGCRIWITPAPGNTYIPLDESWNTYYGSRSRRLKKNNNLSANRLQKAGALRVDRLAPGAVDDAIVDRFVRDIVDISANSWKADTGTTLNNSGPGSFIRQLSESATQRGWLSIWVLSLDDRPIASEFQLVADENVYALRFDFRTGFEELSPGSHLQRVIVEQLFGKGLRRYYMGPGNNAYKQRWTEDAEPLSHVTIYGRSLPGRGLASWERTLKPFATRLRDRLRPAAKQAAGEPDDE